MTDIDVSMQNSGDEITRVYSTGVGRGGGGAGGAAPTPSPNNLRGGATYPSPPPPPNKPPTFSFNFYEKQEKITNVPS